MSNVSGIDKAQIRLSEIFSKLWILIFLPLMFCLIGNEVDFNKLNLNQIGKLAIIETLKIYK